MRIGFSTLWLIVAVTCAPAQRLAPTSASLQAFLDTCPQNDPFYAVFQRDLPILRNGMVSSNFPCVEPYTAMTVSQMTDELVTLQAVRMAYYMDMGRSDYLPWTPFRLYDWMKQRVAGINIDSTQATDSAACCTLIQGRLYIIMGPMSTSTRGAALGIGGLASQVSLLAHETRHSDSNAYGHVSCCGITNGCDQTYDEQNLSPYGVQYYLYKQWLSGSINLGFSCNTNAAQVGSALQAAANSFRTLFCGNQPPALTMPASPGGACIAPCTLTVQEPATLTVSGSGSISAIQVSASTAACGWTADSADTWITAVSGLNTSGMGSATFSIWPNQSGVTRAGSLIVGGIKAPITQSPCAAPCASSVTISSVVSGAPGVAEITANSWVTIYGSNLATSTRQWGATDFSGDELPLSLDGVSVRIDGFPAAISYVSPGQLNVQAPDDGQTGVVQVQVTNTLGTAVANATLTRHAPAWFLFPGTTYVAAVHADGTYLAPAGLFGDEVTSRPAAPGEAVSLFGTGFGVTDPATGSGVLIRAPATLLNPGLATVAVQIGKQTATVQFAGLVAPGLYQFNVVIPQLPDGDAPVVATIGGITTIVDRVIAVQH